MPLTSSFAESYAKQLSQKSSGLFILLRLTLKLAYRVNEAESHKINSEFSKNTFVQKLDQIVSITSNEDLSQVILYLPKLTLNHFLKYLGQLYLSEALSFNFITSLLRAIFNAYKPRVHGDILKNTIPAFLIQIAPSFLAAINKKTDVSFMELLLSMIMTIQKESEQSSFVEKIFSLLQEKQISRFTVYYLINNLVSLEGKIPEQFLRQTSVLAKLMQKLINAIDEAYICEVIRTPLSLFANKVEESFNLCLIKDKKIPDSTAEYVKQLATSETNLFIVSHKLCLDKLRQDATHLPAHLKLISYCIYTYLADNPDILAKIGILKGEDKVDYVMQQKAANSLTASILFLRFICPIILNKQMRKYNIETIEGGLCHEAIKYLLSQIQATIKLIPHSGNNYPSDIISMIDASENKQKILDMISILINEGEILYNNLSDKLTDTENKKAESIQRVSFTGDSNDLDKKEFKLRASVLHQELCNEYYQLIGSHLPSRQQKKSPVTTLLPNIVLIKESKSLKDKIEKDFKQVLDFTPNIEFTEYIKFKNCFHNLFELLKEYKDLNNQQTVASQLASHSAILNTTVPQNFVMAVQPLTPFPVLVSRYPLSKSNSFAKTSNINLKRNIKISSEGEFTPDSFYTDDSDNDLDIASRTTSADFIDVPLTPEEQQVDDSLPQTLGITSTNRE